MEETQIETDYLTFTVQVEVGKGTSGRKVALAIEDGLAASIGVKLIGWEIRGLSLNGMTYVGGPEDD